MGSSRGYGRRFGAALVAATVFAACESDATGPDDGEPNDELPAFTVTATTGWAYVDLDGETAMQVTVSDPATNTGWDIAFFGTGVMLNGGAAGSAGVVGHCLCQNANATAAQVMAMTPESQLSTFESVTAADIPTGEDAWRSDALAPAIVGWYSYDPVAREVTADTDRVWKLRAAEAEDPVYAKFRVLSLEDASQSDAGRITIEYAVQPGAGQPLGESETAVIDVTGGRVYFDLATGAESDASDWDLAFEGYTIRVNSGVSGSGWAGAVLESDAFEEITDASDAPAQVYAADQFGGVFESHPWYRYNLTGDDHLIWPTFDVYLIKRGDEVYKLQIISYYNETADARHITARFAPLTES